MQNDSTALVIDKNVVDRRSVVTILRNEFRLKNSNIHQSASAKDAMTVVRNEPRIDWIISDIDLPDISGFDFLDKARELASSKDSSVILMSSRRDKEALMMAAAAGVDDYVVKPFTTSIMATKIRKIAHGHEKRESERVKDHTVHPVQVQLGEITYEGELIDISLGGCQVRCELFKRGGCVTDLGDVVIKTSAGDLKLSGMLVRIEVDGPGDPPRLRAGFRFHSLTPTLLTQIGDFIASLKTKQQGIQAAAG